MAQGAAQSADQPKSKDWWDRLGAIGVGTMLVAVVGGWYTYQQGELEREARRQETFTQMLAQREKADSELRTAMFQTLIDGYFGERFVGVRPSGVGAARSCGDNEYDCQIMFLELLARNFETIDVAPLFKDLDRKLTRAIQGEQSRPAFRQRERLRKVARSLASREVAALASLKDARIYGVLVRKCQDGVPRAIPVQEEAGVRVIGVTDMQDGNVQVRIDAPGAHGGAKDPAEFSVSFHDMPYIDNSRLPSGQRLAVVMRSYFSSTYAAFVDDIEDPVLREDYRQFLANGERCEQASLRLVLFPENYLGLRDRPYMEDLLNRITKGRL